MNQFTDADVYNFFYCNNIIVSGRCNKKFIDTHCPGLYEYLYNRFDDIDENTPISEIIFRINNNINIRPTCPVCGTYLKYKHGFYPQFCSKKCKWSKEGQKIEREKATNTMIERYGVEHALQSKDILEKLKQNNIKKYGVANVFEAEWVKDKIKETHLDRYGYDHPCKSDIIKLKIIDTNYEKYYSGTDEANELKEIRQARSKETMQKHYGVDYALLNKDLLDKSKNTCRSHYGVDYITQLPEMVEHIKLLALSRSNGMYTSFSLFPEVKEKRKQTCLERYGVEHITLLDEVKEKRKQTCLEKYGVEYSFLSDIVKNKSKLVWLEKYGVDNPWKSVEIKEKIKLTTLERYGVEHITLLDEFKYKTYLTCVKNQSFTGKSKIEKYTHEFLNKIFGKENVLYNIRLNSKYPYKIDFFIKSHNLFIEINAFWRHGHLPYIESDPNCIEFLQKWKNKESARLLTLDTTYYTRAIKQWTYYDVNRRNIAYKNNLRYIEIFSNNILDVMYSIYMYFKNYNEYELLKAYYNFTYDSTIYNEDYICNELVTIVHDYNLSLDISIENDIKDIELKTNSIF